MKINVEKIASYQAGGYLTYRPLTRPPEQVAPMEQDVSGESKGSKAAKKDDLDDKALEKLLGSGITNDVMQFSDQITNAQTQYESLSDAEKEGPRGRQLRSILKGNLGQINALLRSKDILTQSVSKATANGALEEYAVSPQGFVVKTAQGGISQVSFAQFAKDKESGKLDYKPLTNAELANEREYNKNLVGNSKVFEIMNYGIGISKVQEQVSKIASDIGKSSQSTSTGAYDEGTVEAMREAQLAAGQGMFKVKESSSMSTNKPQIERAKQVMWSMLPDNSKNVLRARAAFLEKDPSKVEQRAALLAMDLLDQRLETSQSTVTDMSYTKGAKSGKGGSGGDSTTTIGARESAVNGKTQEEHVNFLSEYGVDIGARMNVLPYEDITHKDKDGVIRPTTINGSDIAKYAYVNKATTLSGEKVDPYGTIFTGDAYYTRLPVRRTANGGLILDEDGAKKLAAAEEEVAALPEGLRTKMNIDRIKKKHGASNLDVQEVILAEAASFDDKYRWGGLGAQKDSKYYKEADETTKKILGDVVDPESKGARNYLDYKSYKHMIIIPSKGEAAARFADSNSFFIPKDGVNLTNPLRGVQTSSRSYGGASSQPSPSAFSIDRLN